MKRMLRILTLVSAFAASPAVAHEKVDRAMGVVESVTAERIVIKGTDGHPVAFTVTADTKLFRGEKPARLEDVQVGERVVVNGRRAGEEFQAVRVKLGPAKSSK
jgi:hypothetical protein